MNPFDPSIFTNTSPCIPCCTTPTDCSCALLIPVFASPYMDLATAQAAVDPANGFVADCIAAGGGMSGGSLTYTATFDGTTLTTSATASSPQVTFDSGAVSISAKAGATLTFSKTAGAQIRASIYRCDGTLVENVSPGSGPITSSALPADDVYYVGAIAFNPPGPGSPFSSCAISMTSTNVYWVNPVIALWDDSGTTRSLWACPKLLLPPLTESTGDWYASCADAASLLATALVSGCVGYETHENQMLYASSYSFSATDGGSSLSYSFACTGGPLMPPNPGVSNMEAWGGINAEAGETITVAWSASGDAGTGEAAQLEIYDDTGTLVETISNNTGADLVSSALPYTGRYTLRLFAGVEVITDITGSVSVSATITSSGTMSVNPIQARYDLGLTCSGTLDCGDSCP